MAKDKEDKRIMKKPVIFDLYVKFRAIPKPYRAQTEGFEGCSTDGDFSKKFKVSEQTLSTWKTYSAFKEKREKYLRDWGQDKTPNVIASLYKRILQEGKSSEISLWLKYINDWREGIDISGNMNHNYTKLQVEVVNSKEKTKSKDNDKQGDKQKDPKPESN